MTISKHFPRVARDTFNMLARMYNFTTASYRDPDLDWGLYQKGGEHDLTGEWGGVMGDVVLGKHPTSLSEWYHIKERWPILVKRALKIVVMIKCILYVSVSLLV